MKKWRRSGGGRTAVVLPPGPELAAQAGEEVLAGNLAGYVGTHFLLSQTSPDGVAGWVDFAVDPIASDPQTIFALGFAGFWMRAAISTGGFDPITQWSNVVQISA